MKTEKKLKDMNKEELISLIQNQNLNTTNTYLAISGVEISSPESLNRVEQTADRILKKHKDFILLRREQKLKTGFDG